MRGVTNREIGYVPDNNISTHTPHARCDGSGGRSGGRRNKFLLTHLMRGVTAARATEEMADKFLLTHLMRGVTPCNHAFRKPLSISTHTPHARCDVSCTLSFLVVLISTHTPHARCDLQCPWRHSSAGYFYSHTSCEV